MGFSLWIGGFNITTNTFNPCLMKPVTASCVVPPVPILAILNLSISSGFSGTWDEKLYTWENLTKFYFRFVPTPNLVFFLQNTTMQLKKYLQVLNVLTMGYG